MSQRVTLELNDEVADATSVFAEKHGMSVSAVVNTALDDWLSDRANIEAYAPHSKGGPTQKVVWKDAKPHD
jgi:hypothetical protein